MLAARRAVATVLVAASAEEVSPRDSILRALGRKSGGTKLNDPNPSPSVFASGVSAISRFL